MSSSVAIVILNWNGVSFLERFIPILYNNTPKEIGEIIIADNGSTDSSVEWLKENYPMLRLILLDKNYGFTGGYNRALAQIEAKYFILLNSDIRVPIASYLSADNSTVDNSTADNSIVDNSTANTTDWLTPLYNFMEQNPKAGICQPKILSEQNPTYFEYAGAAGGFIDRYGFPFCRGRILSCLEEDKGQYNTPIQTFWASGACMMVRNSIWRELNGLDDLFFAHMEEIDFCWRAQLKGYEVWCVPQSSVYHVGGGTLPNNSPRKLLLNFRNNLLMLHKNLPVGFSKKWAIFRRMSIDGAAAVAFLLQGKFKFFMVVINAHREFGAMRKKYPAATFPSPTAPKPKGLYNGGVVLGFFLGRRRFVSLKKEEIS